MRAWFVIPLFAITACGGSLGPRGIPVLKVRGNANGFLHTNVRANVNVKVDARVRVEAPLPPPPPPAPAVELRGAPVVEFFGIPLEGAQDVVFVLDVSGSMDDPAKGQLAQIAPPPPSGPQPTPSASLAVPPSAGPGPGAQPVPPPPPDPNTPPPDPNAPPPDPNAQQQPTQTVETTGPRKIEVAQAELIDALSKLPAGTRMNVVFFNSNVDAIAPTILVLDEQNRPTIEAYVRETDADGRTALAPAMRVAFLLNAKRVVLLSDGLGNVNGSSEDVMRDAREAVRAGVRIDTIGIGTDQDRWLLSSLANESGGLYQAF
ncbi:MAG TPA: VWA domain-containing protein [Kofleriaceae bacterium]|nr:VWA domain-containing protein [Kofleriaceae bacterium]